MWPSVEQIEAFGKAGGAILAILVLGFIVYHALNNNSGLTDALAAQIELAEKQTSLAERQTEALEKLVEIYSGD